MSEVDFIIVMQKLDLEGQCVVEATALLFQGVLEVTNVLPISIPSNSLSIILFCALFGVKERLHALVIGTLVFDQINNIKLVRRQFLNIGHPEVKPLRVSRGVMVVFENQVIFVLANFDGSSEIARFKAALEDEGVVVLVFLYVIWPKF